MSAAEDRLGRPLRDLRVSVTDRCNLRCTYCMPSRVFGPGFAFMPRHELLSYEEIARICRLFAEQGVRGIRLTGGEPLLRRQLERLVSMLKRLDGIDEVALTTNGTMLAAHAEGLADAGLDRVTVSLDALDAGALRAMSDRDFPLDAVLAGIERAATAGLNPVKVNMVVRRGVNDHCVLEMAEYFRGRGEILRFIEYMDVGDTNGWRPGDVMPAAEIRDLIDARWPLRPLDPTRQGEVASRFAYCDGAGEVGFIHAVSQPFCSGCTRARLSADGKLYTCLFASEGEDLRAPLRGGASDEELSRRITGVWRARTDRYSADRATLLRQGRHGGPTPKIEMSYIGG
jgi:cyclic pyranopterin phosphate synthase